MRKLKLKPWMAILLAPIVGTIVVSSVVLAVKYLFWVFTFICVSYLGVMILAPYVEKED